MRGACSFADVLLAELEFGVERAAAMAAVYGARSLASAAPALNVDSEPLSDEGVVLPPDLPPPPGKRESKVELPPPFAPTPFWRMLSRTTSEASDGGAEPRDGGLRKDDLKGSARLPEAPDLMPWPRLRQRLHALLATPRRSRRVDEPALLARAARREPILSAPRARARRFPSSLWLVCDRSPHLLPTWTDQDRLEQRLAKLIPGAALCTWTFMRGPRSAPLERIKCTLTRPALGAPLLVVSDLGASGTLGAQLEWSDFIQRQTSRGHAFHALAPVPRRRWPTAVTRLGRVEPWDRTRADCGPHTHEDQAKATDALLRSIAWLTFVEPGLLRAVRFTFSAAECDIGTEIDTWARFRDGHVDGATLDPESRAALLDQKLLEPDRARRERLARAFQLIQRWRQAYAGLIATEERIVWGCTVDGALADASGVDVSAEVRAVKRLIVDLERNPDPRLVAWLDRVCERSFGPVGSNSAAQAALQSAQAAARSKRRREPFPYGLIQRGSRLVGVTIDGSRPGNTSLLGWITSKTEMLWASHDDGRHWTRFDPSQGVEPTDAPLRVRSTCDEVVVVPYHKPIGADAMGRDAKGLWVDCGFGAERTRFRWEPPTGKPDGYAGEWRLDAPHNLSWASDVGFDGRSMWAEVRVKKVAFRMRRIPGGRFVMGSAETELGRFDNEHQHVVELSGFWLGETPVTQELWTAIQRPNPSHNKSPRFPVESVSWENCKRFLEELNREMSGLAARFPTESEWEYACRAGTTTATYAGDLSGVTNSPNLERIAWYGSRTSGTQTVRMLHANAFGLYDMLGNVYEWCADWSGRYPAQATVDPVGPSSGDGRVLRGGAWLSHARNVRAARRDASPPSYSSHSIGVRLARGAIELPGAKRGVSEAGPRPEASEQAARGRGARPGERSLRTRVGRGKDEQ